MIQYSFATSFGYFNLEVDPDQVGYLANRKKVAGGLIGLSITPKPTYAAVKANQFTELLTAWETGEYQALLAIPVVYPQTEFRTQVSIAMRKIPAGSVWSYSELAAQAGNPTAVRAAASVCARNPIPIVIPCHRVIRNDGSLGNYFYGVELKDRLLRAEGWH